MAFECLVGLKILDILRDFDPIVVSTVCLDIDIPSSDLDIICEVHELEVFQDAVKRHFGAFPGFNTRRSESDPSAMVCQFFTDTFEVEIFAHNVPTERQNAYRHLVQIHRVISIGGSETREALRALKLGGNKTEPSVARLLNLKGDPYQAVLELEHLTDNEIAGQLSVL